MGDRPTWKINPRSKIMIDQWWNIEPNDDFLEINDDDIEEMKFNAGIDDGEDDDGWFEDHGVRS